MASSAAIELSSISPKGITTNPFVTPLPSFSDLTKIDSSVNIPTSNSSAHGSPIQQNRGQLRLQDENGNADQMSRFDLEEEGENGSGSGSGNEQVHNPTEVLPPVDGGSKAWLFLIAATYLEMIIWGLPFSIGVLHVYWTNTLFKNNQNDSTITLAATLQTGLLYMLVAFSGPIFTTFPRYTKISQVVGLLVASAAMVASAFVTKPWHLIITIGIFYPMLSATYFPCATLVFEWFHAKRGFASGVMYSGTGAGGFIFPFLMQGLINKFGYKSAMISLGLGYAITGNIALLAIKRRIPLSRYDQNISSSSSSSSEPNSRMRRRRPRIDWSFVRRSPLYLGFLTIGLTSMGNFIPSLWLPSYVDELGLKNPDGTALIAILNASSVLGNGLLGYLSDKLSLRWTISISCVGSAMACAFLWGFGTNNGVLITFAIIYGLLGPSFTTLWTKMVGLVSKDDPVVTGLTYSMFAFMRGVGNMSSGPISESLLKIGVLKGATGAYGFHNYGILLVYTAVTILVGGAIGLFFQE
ncbi:uncharacterized protein IL334_007595 [Kwoniella shivajii]|uniref:Monocarboxylic acid transporter n=1 Tax=Kwoniella shivajii TaxID=564305 RepID=A0ABZ1D938_9TREE|nr:hypothetical protein IL334_007595 [Kwoniella shivajii]